MTWMANYIEAAEKNRDQWRSSRSNLPCDVNKMVDEATKRTLAAIPLLKIKAGPRDGEAWITRLKEEYQSLIKVPIFSSNIMSHIKKLIFTILKV